MMNINKWTLGLAAVGLVSLPVTNQAEEKVNALGTALSSTIISGYVNTSAHWDFGTGNNHVPGLSFYSGKQDGFNMDVVQLSISKSLDENQWAAGYKVDLWFGPDASALGTSSSSSDFAVAQAYIALRAPVGNGLDFKIGTFDTIIGYETRNAGDNPNYSRSYGYSIEPTTHTGILATYQFCEFFSAAAGVANSFGPSVSERSYYGKGSESYKTYMASVALTAPSSWGWVGGSAVYAGMINGLNKSSSINAKETSFYIGATINTPLKALKVGTSFDYLAAHGTTANGKWANAFALYASYQATEKLSVHARGEYASTDIGAASGATILNARKVFAFTGTVQYDLWKKNIMFRQ